MRAFVVACGLLFFVQGGAMAQMAVVASGGSTLSAMGSIDISYGQVVCQYALGNDFRGGEGVQQPYPPVCPDTVLSSIEVRDVCDSIVWNDMVFHSDTVYRHSMPTAAGCDSVAILRLSVRHSSYVEEQAQAAFRYSFNGKSYNASGEYRISTSLRNADGCDSIILLHLSLLRTAPLPVIFNYNDQFLMVDHYPAGEGGNYAEYRAYRWYQNGVLLNFATSDNYFQMNNHSGYRTLSGCFYVEVYTGVDNYWVRSNEICITPSKSSSVALQPVLTLYPNPGDSRGRVFASMERVPDGSILMLYGLDGRLLWQNEAEEGTVLLPAGLPTGVYSVVLSMPQKSVTRKLVIR